MAKRISKKRYNAIMQVTRERTRKQELRRPVKLFTVLNHKIRDPLLRKPEKVFERWISKEDWLHASNLNILHGQGHSLNQEQKDMVEAWHFAQEDTLEYLRKNHTWMRTHAKSVEIVANPHRMEICKCCQREFAVTIPEKVTGNRVCMLCDVACVKRRKCQLTGVFKLYEYSDNPFMEIEVKELDEIFVFKNL